MQRRNRDVTRTGWSIRAVRLRLGLASSIACACVWGALGVANAQVPGAVASPTATDESEPIEEPTEEPIEFDDEELVVLGDISGRYPLDPPDTSSPQATLRTFFTDGRETWRVFLGEHDSQRQRYEMATRRLRRATRCLDLSQVPAGSLRTAGNRTTILLLDVLERIEMPRWSEIPDLAAVEAEGLTRWRIPHTDIELHRVDSGPREGEFLFTAETVERAESFYRLTRRLEPRKNAAIYDGYALYRTLPGWMIPLDWIRRLPAWMRTDLGGQSIWQWIALLLPIVPGFGVVALASRWARRKEDRENLDARLRRIAVPVVSIAFAYLMGNIWVGQIGVGSGIVVARLFFESLLVLGLAWLSVQAGGIVAELVLKSPGIDARSLDASMVRIAARLISIVLAVMVLIEGARLMGVPIMGLLAGLGVGGIAVALAAQSTIENFIGSMTLFADRPVRVGDFCRFGDELGTIEGIGLRSTRIRTLGRSLITVPNAQFSRIEIDNFTHRDSNLCRVHIALSYDTTPAQLRDVLERLRQLLRAHARVLDEPARVRLNDFGQHAFDIEVFAYVDETDWNAYLEIREDLLLQITDTVEGAGAKLAVPAQTTYLVPSESGEPGPAAS